MRSIFDDIGEHRIHSCVFETGTRTPVLLIHGVIVSHRYMMPLAHELAPYFNVYVPDLPGHGFSSKPHDPLSVAQQADFIASYIRHWQLDRPIVVGNSYGCQIQAELASRYPDLVRELVMLGPTIDASARNTWIQAFRLIIDIPRERPSVIGVVTRDVIDMGFRRAVKSIQIMMKDKIEEKLPRIPHRTVAVRGERDPIVPQEWLEQVVARLEHGELFVIEGAPHDLNYSAAPQLLPLFMRYVS